MIKGRLHGENRNNVAKIPCPTNQRQPPSYQYKLDSFVHSFLSSVEIHWGSTVCRGYGHALPMTLGTAVNTLCITCTFIGLPPPLDYKEAELHIMASIFIPSWFRTGVLYSRILQFSKCWQEGRTDTVEERMVLKQKWVSFYRNPENIKMK